MSDTKSTKPDPEPPVAEEAPDQQAIALSKHLDAWRGSYGDETVDTALELAASRRKAAAGQARADAGQQPSAAPAGRSSSNPKSTATA